MKINESRPQIKKSTVKNKAPALITFNQSPISIHDDTLEGRFKLFMLQRSSVLERKFFGCRCGHFDLDHDSDGKCLIGWRREDSKIAIRCKCTVMTYKEIEIDEDDIAMANKYLAQEREVA